MCTYEVIKPLQVDKTVLFRTKRHELVHCVCDSVYVAMIERIICNLLPLSQNVDGQEFAND